MSAPSWQLALFQSNAAEWRPHGWLGLGINTTAIFVLRTKNVVVCMYIHNSYDDIMNRVVRSRNSAKRE